MDYYVTTEEFKAFLNSLPQYHYEAKFKRLKPFLQKLAVCIVQHIFPNERVEWFSNVVGISAEDSALMYLVKTELPENVHKTDANFIPTNRFDYIKTSYIKASLSMYYEEVHPRAGDSYDGWWLEILLPDGGTFTLKKEDPNIYAISTKGLSHFRNELPKWINSSIK